MTALALTDTRDLREAFADAFRPPDLMTLSEWADRFYILPRDAAKPGRWRTDRAPYLREPLDALGPNHPAERVVLKWASQLGKSSLMIIWFGYTAHLSPASMMIVQSTLGEAKKFSKKRIATMVRDCPELKAVVTEDKSRDDGNTILEKNFPGGSLVMVGANSPAGIASLFVERLALDECDRYPKSAGDDGDPTDVAIQRTATFAGRRKIGQFSTPTIKGESRIDEAFEEGNQCQYWMPCPSCAEPMRFTWGQMVWEDPTRPVQVCPSNGCVVEEYQKEDMLAAGEWVASADGDGKTVSYQLSALYCPLGIGWTWAEIVKQFRDAKGNPERLKAWVNLKLGECWDAQPGEGLESEPLLARRENYGHKAPLGVLAVTIGVDFQGDRCEVKVKGWGIGEESWLLGYYVIYGDPTDPPDTEGLWTELDARLSAPVTRVDGLELRPVAACLDSGDPATQHNVLDFCHERWKDRVWAVKGATTDVSIWPPKVSKAKYRDRNMFSIGVNAAKTVIHHRIKDVLAVPSETWPDRGPGLMHWPEWTTIDHFEQLTSERRIVHPNRRKPAKWIVKKGRRNEGFDTEVYAYCALRGWLSMGNTLEQQAARVDEAVAKQNEDDHKRTQRRTPKTTTNKKPWVPRRKGWLK